MSSELEDGQGEIEVSVVLRIGVADFRKQRRWLNHMAAMGSVPAMGLQGVCDKIADAIYEEVPKAKLT